MLYKTLIFDTKIRIVIKIEAIKCINVSVNNKKIAFITQNALTLHAQNAKLTSVKNLYNFPVPRNIKCKLLKF